jgi:hypothetical protein
MSRPDFDSVSWYANWSTYQLHAHRKACLNVASEQELWGGNNWRKTRAQCLGSARHYAAEIARRGVR